MPMRGDPEGLGSQRGDGPKAARPFGVALGSPPDRVTSLARATSPRCTTFLAGELPSTITMPQDRSERP